MDYIRDLQELSEILSEKISEKVRKIRNSGMNDGDLETLDKLTHALKSVKAVIGMTEDGHSGNYPYSYKGRSMAPRRDGMGRYSRGDYVDKMRELMENAPDDQTHHEIKRLIEKLENA